MTDFWTDKRVVVTGGAGMVGSQLVPLLLGVGADVVVLDNFSRGQNRIAGADYVAGDAGDVETCLRVMSGAFAVFNLAAEVAGVAFNQRHHAFMFERNVRVLAAPLRAASECSAARFLQVSSVCVYAPEYNNPALEENGQVGEPTPANIGYSMAKRMGERMAEWYAGEFGLHTVIVRPSNIFGLHDYFDGRAHVIPSLINQVYSDAPYIEVFGDGRTFREFLYSADAAEGMLFVAEHGKPGEVYNLGTDGRTCVNTRELLAMIQQLAGIHKPWREASRGHTGDAFRWSDCSKIGALGWKARTNLIGGLSHVLEWYNAER